MNKNIKNIGVQTLGCEKCMSNMSRIIDAKSNRDDDNNARNDIYGQSPGLHVSHNINQTHHHANHGQNASPNVG